jgi:tetratricopeptide (TPR) repeat protein
VEDAGAVHLADAIVMAYVQSDAALSELERGRLDALRGRFAWKRGDHSTAAEHYERVKRLARRIHSAELEVRADVGHAIVSRLRGNYPASRKAAQRAVRIAEANNLGRLAALGHQSLMIAAVVAGDFNTALRHSWLAYVDVRGDEAAEVGRLADIAQLFLDAGHVDIARAGFTAIWRRPMPERVRLPVLGGAALAAARQGDVNAVLDLETIVDITVDDRTLPYASATVRLDMAEALCHVGRTAAAERFLTEATAVSETRQYHELTHRARSLRLARSAPPLTQPLTAETQEIGAAVRALATAGV